MSVTVPVGAETGGAALTAACNASGATAGRERVTKGFAHSIRAKGLSQESTGYRNLPKLRRKGLTHKEKRSAQAKFVSC